MRVFSLLAVGVSVLAPLAVAAQQPPSAPPPPAVKVGQQAPDFTLRYLSPTPDGKVEPKTVSLAGFKGQKTVILAFFPAAFSPG